MAAADGKTWNRKINITTTEQLREDASLTNSGEHIVRVARMHIPATAVAYEMALQQLNAFIGTSFVNEWP